MTDTGEMGPRDAVWLAIWDWLGKQRASPYDLVDAILALPQLAAQQARIVELEGALQPFGWMAEQIDHSRVSLRVTPPVQADDDKQEVLVAGNEDGFSTLTRGHFRRARAALRKDPQQ